MEINVSIEPIGGGLLHGGDVEDIDIGILEETVGYRAVVLTVNIKGVFGEGTVKPELNLTNFLSIYDLIT